MQESRDTEEMGGKHTMEGNEKSWRGRKETIIINSDLL